MPSIEAEVVTIDYQLWPTLVRSQGSLFGDEQSTVGTEVAGRVAKVHFDLGDSLQKGDAMVTLDLQEFELQVVQAEAQLQQARASVGLKENDDEQSLNPEAAPPVREALAIWQEAKSNLQRAKDLQSNNAIARGEFDQAVAAEHVAEARYSSALNSVLEKIAVIGVRRAELSLARQRLEDAVIQAPIDGYVQRRQVAPGSYLMVGQPIAVMVSTNPLRFRGTVPERHAQSLAVGQEVQLRIESVDQPRLAKITRISPMLELQSRALVFEAEIPNDDLSLRAGLFAEAEIVIDPQAQALVIPHSAIVEFAGTQKVWKVVDGVAGEQEVLAGARREQGLQILEGLNVGDRILLHGEKGKIARVVTNTSTDP
ncbi:MAG: efflux RND transporter periplasmic adaptor subunit [bacterium]|nr:efflux RND transporter periplasmic adaptor subunit [bacterium]